MHEDVSAASARARILVVSDGLAGSRALARLLTGFVLAAVAWSWCRLTAVHHPLFLDAYPAFDAGCAYRCS